jgi:branched-chain amino acid transport system ATP-binding protein
MALGVADRCYVLNKGQVVFEASAESLKNDSQIKQRFLGV